MTLICINIANLPVLTITHPRTRPDRRVQRILTPRRMVAVASDLHQPEDAIVMRCKSALGIAVTIATLESGE
jgi:hypothetical protein